MMLRKGEEMRRNIGKDKKLLAVIGYGLSGLIAVACLIPFLMVLSASFTAEETIVREGFGLWPKQFSLEAYTTVFKDPAVIGRAYLTTIVLTVVGSMVGVLITAMTAYVLQRKDFEWRNKISFFFYFTTLFNGGLVPSYVLMVRYLGMKNNYLALLLPLMFSVFNLLVMRSYMSGVPDALMEAAMIDGCGDFKVFWKIMLPLSKPAVATISLFIALAYWNDWYNAMLYIDNEKMYPLQYFLYQQVNNIEAYKKIIAQQGGGAALGGAINLPTQSLKMALTVVVTGPIILAYPFAQKYFVEGITIGAVKG